MKYVILSSILLVIVCCPFAAWSQATALPITNKTEIYIVRHGEKAKEGGDDPLLTADGNARAGDLMRRLKRKKIQRIYVTEFKRTQQTADSMRLQLRIDTVHYLADTACVNLFNAITAHGDWGKRILIVSHSNTIQKIIYKLGVKSFSQEYIPAAEFDNLYYIRFKNKNVVLVESKYGKRSVALAPKME